MVNISVSILVLLPFFCGIILLAIKGRNSRVLLPLWIATSVLAATMLIKGDSMHAVLGGSYGVELMFDPSSWTFVLMNGLVFIGVTLSVMKERLPLLACPLMAMLHGTANAVFISYDLFNIFICIDLIGILAFLFIRLGKKPRQIWSAVQYLIVGNVGMILYLVGCLYGYKATGSFSMETLPAIPSIAVYFLVIGLSVKGGVFLAGLWLPEAHGEAESAVSALLSGVIVKCGIAPLLRIAELSPAAAQVVPLLALASALYGVIYAMFDKDVKRMLAYHTISQAGFILAVPSLGHLYAISHGLFKSWLFLAAGKLPSRSFEHLKKEGIKVQVWLPLLFGALAISGMPMLGGFGAKSMILGKLSGLPAILMYLAALGTAISFSKIIFLPLADGGDIAKAMSFSGAFYFLSLVLRDVIAGYFGVASILRTFLIIGAGWLIYLTITSRRKIDLPKGAEGLDHILGLLFVVLLLMIGVFGS
jgi:multicomponent Na+:H+ antiporter subunit D